MFHLAKHLEKMGNQKENGEGCLALDVISAVNGLVTLIPSIVAILPFLVVLFASRARIIKGFFRIIPKSISNLQQGWSSVDKTRLFGFLGNFNSITSFDANLIYPKKEGKWERRSRFSLLHMRHRVEALVIFHILFSRLFNHCSC